MTYGARCDSKKQLDNFIGEILGWEHFLVFSILPTTECSRFKNKRHTYRGREDAPRPAGVGEGDGPLPEASWESPSQEGALSQRQS